MWRVRLGMCRMPGLRLAVRVVWASSTTTRPRASVCAWDVTWVSIKMLWLRGHALGVLRVVMRAKLGWAAVRRARLVGTLRMLLKRRALCACLVATRLSNLARAVFVWLVGMMALSTHRRRVWTVR